MHAERTLRRQLLGRPCPVHRLLCFAPANFGSDLATLGQSFLGKFRTTFFNRNSRPEDFLESGKAVLQGLEPASPFQWELSCYDLHGQSTYFNPEPTGPTISAAIRSCSPPARRIRGVEAKLIKQRAMLGTDGTVRIPGTSLNTRGCSLDFREAGPGSCGGTRCKYDDIPFAVFAGFNHGSIIDPKQARFHGPDGPGTLAARRAEVGARSRQLSAAGDYVHARPATPTTQPMPAERQDAYQQFFFRVRDDVDQIVEDYYIDFHVATRDGSAHQELTVLFRRAVRDARLPALCGDRRTACS